MSVKESAPFLLAKDGIVVAAVGVTILAKLATQRPIMYTVSRAFVGMAGYSPDGWDTQWDSSARFRHV